MKVEEGGTRPQEINHSMQSFKGSKPRWVLADQGVIPCSQAQEHAELFAHRSAVAMSRSFELGSMSILNVGAKCVNSLIMSRICQPLIWKEGM